MGVLHEEPELKIRCNSDDLIVVFRAILGTLVHEIELCLIALSHGDLKEARCLSREASLQCILERLFWAKVVLCDT